MTQSTEVEMKRCALTDNQYKLYEEQQRKARKTRKKKEYLRNKKNKILYQSEISNKFDEEMVRQTSDLKQQK